MKPGVLRTTATAALVVWTTAPAATEGFPPNYAKADTSRWRCRLCPFEMASFTRANWAAGAIHVAGAEARFGRDNGLVESGIEPDMNAAYRRRDENGKTTEIVGRRLGLDSRTLHVRVYDGYRDLRLVRRDIPRNISTRGRTPFLRDPGGTSLALPADWAAAFDTADMAKLDDSARFDHATRRTRTSFNVRVRPHPSWWVATGISRETKSGTAQTYADFLYQATGLPKPVRFLTDEFAAGTGWERRSFQVAAEFRNSRFRNRNHALEWQSPWLGPVVARGRKALAPDSRARDLTLVSRSVFGNRTTLNTTLTWSEARQDDVFVPYTTNTGLDLDPLPANSLDGLARFFAATVNLVSRPTNRLRLTVGHRLRDRDNATATRIFTPVRGDLYSPGPVSSRSYDVAKSTTELGVQYRPWPRIGVALHTEANRVRRDPAEVATNKERRHRVDLSVHRWRGFRANLRFARSDRDASEFRDLTPNNPLTRRYHQAEREQRVWRASVGYAAQPLGLWVDLVAECRKNAYPASVLGLLHDRNCARGGDIGYAPTERLSLLVFHRDNETGSATAGRTGFRGPDWRYETEDSVATAGLGLDLPALVDGRLRLSVEYVQSLGAGRYATDWAGQSVPFPEMVSNHRSLDLDARFRWREGRALVFRLRHERYRAEDWALAEDLAAVRNVLSFANASPRYSNNLVAVSYEVSFGQ